MVRDWNTIKEVLEDVENRPPDDHLGLWFTNVVGDKNPAMLSAFSLAPDPITEEDKHATEKWFHARMLLHAGMFITPPSQSMSRTRDGFSVLSLSLEGAALLDLLRECLINGNERESQSTNPFPLYGGRLGWGCAARKRGFSGGRFSLLQKLSTYQTPS